MFSKNSQFQHVGQEWRHNTEFMLNLPETEGIAKLYEATDIWSIALLNDEYQINLVGGC